MMLISMQDQPSTILPVSVTLLGGNTTLRTQKPNLMPVVIIPVSRLRARKLTRQ